MRSASLLFFVGASSLLFGCTHPTGAGSDPAPARSQALPSEPTSEAQPRGVVIGTIVTHDKRVSILGKTPDGDLRVVVRTHEGVLVADGISVEELHRVDPTLHAIVTSAVASTPGTYVDATLDRAPTKTPELWHGL